MADNRSVCVARVVVVIQRDVLRPASVFARYKASRVKPLAKEASEASGCDAGGTIARSIGHNREHDRITFFAEWQQPFSIGDRQRRLCDAVRCGARTARAVLLFSE